MGEKAVKIAGGRAILSARVCVSKCKYEGEKKKESLYLLDKVNPAG